MSALVAVLLERDRLYAVSGASSGASSRAPVIERPWRGDDLCSAIDAIRADVGTPSGIVLVVGLGWLEIAEPLLPPVDAATAREIVWREADRHVAIEGDVAVVCEDAFAFAIEATQLRAWVDALRLLAPVRAIVTVPQVAADLLASPASSASLEAHVAAGTDERGVLRVRAGQLQSVRRVPAALQEPSAHDARILTSAAIATHAFRWSQAPLSAQLLDQASLAGASRERTRRTWMSAALATASVVVLALAAEHRRDAQLDALRARIAQLETSSAPGARATGRVVQANAEAAVVSDARAVAARPDAPLRVLAQLTRVLPTDVVVQKIDWDGTQWRVEGTADKAPRLVPLLDSDAHFRDVRMLTPSTRFLDIGRQRETFTIGFRVVSSSGRSTADSMTDSARRAPAADGGAHGSN